MGPSLEDRILARELSNGARRTRLAGFKAMYSDRTFIDNLDIVNELGGHDGCVNALSWSRSGRYLASGSDDTHINIHTYLPENSVNPFNLSTVINSGHTQNIFSVKFMPHSNDGTIVSCAADSQVRVFDIEYSGKSSAPSANSALSSIRRNQSAALKASNTREINDGNTNCRVYRSHSHRVKRIVTESSPYHFLTCSEDGEVRQWDLRQPSSSYPSSRRGRTHDSDQTTAPPPLISYKKYNMGINTISCSTSQPHYIALGGDHLHCFLHDRRMTGRDIQSEKGQPAVSKPASKNTKAENDKMSQATRCVRKFAPSGTAISKKGLNGHITACKISDRHPNEIIASWSSDSIYGFDLVRSPDADETTDDEKIGNTFLSSNSSNHRHSKDLKRKRSHASTGENSEPGRAKTRPSNSVDQSATSETDPNIPPTTIPNDSEQSQPESDADEVQHRSLKIAEAVLKLKQELFEFKSGTESERLPIPDSTLTNILDTAGSILPDVSDVITSWRYPVEPSAGQLEIQVALRKRRECSRHFVQACGTIARVMSFESPELVGTNAEVGDRFQHIQNYPGDTQLSRHELFCYQYLKAVLLWVEGGVSHIKAGFTRPPNSRRDDSRYPIGESDDLEIVQRKIISYLHSLAGEREVVDINTSRFERTDTRVLFESQSVAVTAFFQLIREASSIDEGEKSSSSIQIQEQGSAGSPEILTLKQYWGLTVARGVLLSAISTLSFKEVDLAFGGTGRTVTNDFESQTDINTDSSLQVADIERYDMGLDQLHSQDSEIASETHSERPNISITRQSHEDENGNTREDQISRGSVTEVDDEGGDTEYCEDDGDSSDDDENGDDEDNEDEDDEEHEYRHRLLETLLGRRQVRTKIEKDVPCSSHTKCYSGHANERTVKDVGFYGLDDEYVVSGSDDGNLFIWDRKTSELVNILEGDGEVVNVVQGHPYEPMLAVSGIDHTVKIFSSDRRAQWDAQEGIGVTKSLSSGFSSLDFDFHYLPPGGPPRPRSNRGGRSQDNNKLTSKKRMANAYEITARNDSNQQDEDQSLRFTELIISIFHRNQSHIVQIAERIRRGQLRERAAGAGGTAGVEDECRIM